MEKLTIEVIWAPDLPQSMKDEYEVSSDDESYYMIIKHDGEIISVQCDYMEPEDAIFERDLKWVKTLIIEAYELGVIDGAASG